MTRAREDLAPKSNLIETRDVSLAELNERFDVSSGHNHNGINSARIDYNDLINVPNYDFMFYSLEMPENEFDVLDSSGRVLSVTWKNQSSRTFLAAPSHSSGQPLFREIVLNDIPDLSSLYSTVSHTHVLNDLSDVNANPSPGDALVWNSVAGEWQAGKPGTVINSLNDISDVSITEITSNEILVWNGTSWINNTLEEAGIARATHNHDTVYLKLTGGTLSGVLTAPGYNITDTNTKILEGASNSVRIQTNNGYVDIGPQNTSYAHFSTDRSAFQFNKPIEAVTQFKISGSNTYFTSIEGRINNNVVWHAGNDGANSGLDADLLDGQQGSYYLNWSNFTNTPTTISGYGITDAALQSDLTSHTAATTSVHGITNTADLALKSGSVNQFSDITSSGTIIEDAVSKRHNQNTDIGTSSTTFYIGTSGPKIKNNSGIFELKNNADTAYVDLVVNNLVVKGTTTTIESETITFNDNILVLNNNYTGSAPTENAGLEVERGTLVNASLIWDESKDLWRTGLAGSEKTIVSEGNTVTVTGDTTGSATFDSNGNISVSIQVVDDSHNHIISNIDGLQAALDSKSSTTHNHDSVYLKLVGGTLTGDLSINKTLAVIDAGSSSNNTLSLQSMGSVEVVIDNNNNDTNKLFAIKSNSQANDPITKVDETGNFTTAGYVAVYNGSAKIIYNASTESLDFVFV